MPSTWPPTASQHFIISVNITTSKFPDITFCIEWRLQLDHQNFPRYFILYSQTPSTWPLTNFPRFYFAPTTSLNNSTNNFLDISLLADTSNESTINFADILFYAHKVLLLCNQRYVSNISLLTVACNLSTNIFFDNKFSAHKLLWPRHFILCSQTPLTSYLPHIDFANMSFCTHRHLQLDHQQLRRHLIIYSKKNHKSFRNIREVSTWFFFKTIKNAPECRSLQTF